MTDFNTWWEREGSGMIPNPGEDFEEHAKRIAQIAWDNGAYKATQPTDEGISKAARVLSDRTADACGIDKDDNWAIYGNEFIADARAVLNAARETKSLTALVDEKPTLHIEAIELKGHRIDEQDNITPYSRTVNGDWKLMDGDSLNFKLATNK